jgi:carbamate kinase
MNRKEEIAADLLVILKKVYNISPYAEPSEKQLECVKQMADYLEENISLRRKKKDVEEKECSTD